MAEVYLANSEESKNSLSDQIVDFIRDTESSSITRYFAEKSRT
jgi:hypothetical protein